MRTLGAIGFGVAVTVALVYLAGGYGLVLGGVAAGAAVWFLGRRKPLTDRQQTARAVAIGVAVIAVLWLVAVVVALSAIPDDFSENF